MLLDEQPVGLGPARVVKLAGSVAAQAMAPSAGLGACVAEKRRRKRAASGPMTNSSRSSKGTNYAEYLHGRRPEIQL